MISKEILYNQLQFVLDETNFDFLGKKYRGKVRDTYSKNGNLYLIASDRLSCFDRVLTSIPFKGEVLTRLAHQWFELSKNIIANHVIDVPDPNVMLVSECQIVPIEVVVRAYLTGSAWREYSAGQPTSGIHFPKGLKINQRLPHVTLTPSTKAPQGDHDEPISETEIIKRGIVSQKLWSEIREAALNLFAFGEEVALQRGLILVDTKYEFGLKDGKLLLADEIHTLDSSRYWVKDTYEKAFVEGTAPEMLDKEPIRQWLLSQGFKGDGPIPAFSDDYRIELSKHYISAYERISGKSFQGEVGSVRDRIEKKLK